MRVVAPEQRVRSLPGAIAELEIRQPAMADLLPEHADSVLFSPRNFCVGSSGYLPSQSITTMLRSRPALPKSRDESKMSWPMPRISLATVDLVGEGVADDRRVGPEQS